MKTIKVAEATQLQLNWLVAKVEGKVGVLHDDGITRCIVIAAPSGVYKGTYSPSINWTQGGPIIEREGGFELKVWLESSPDTKCEAHIHNYEGDWIEFGPTPLIAAMRCYVASKLGDEVEVPEELE